MKFIISGKNNFNVTDALRERVTEKLSKFHKFFKEEPEVHVTLSVEKKRQIVEVTIYFGGDKLRAEAENDDMYAAIDKVVDLIERQIIRNKTKLSKKMHESAYKAHSFGVKENIKEDDYKVIRKKKFPVKPMDIEEAILQMNMIGHEFFVFINDETKQINIVYRRKSGDYGLIEPEA